MNKKINLKILIPLVLLSHFSFAQPFFNEKFDYLDYETFKIISENRKRWTFFHSENQDFNNNRMIDRWEDIKSIDFWKDEEGNTAIRFELNKMNNKILREDVMKNGEIDGEEVDYHTFFNHINRNEIATWDDPNLSAFRPNKKYNFDFEILIPEEFVFEKQNCDKPSKANYELTGQWHFSYAVLKGNTMSPISLRIVCDEWMLNLNPNNNSEEKDEDFISLGKIEKGKWVKWKFQLRFSHKKRGYIYLYKDGQLMYSKRKAKTIFAKRSTDGTLSTIYFKIGVYKPHWWSRDTNVTERILFYDNIYISR